MATFVDGLFAAGVLLGGGLCCAGWYTYRSRDQLGTTAFAAFLAVIGLGTALAGVSGLLGLTIPSDSEVELWSQLSIVFWLFSAVPWIVFALQYTGRYTDVGPRLVVLLSIPPSGIALQIGLSVVDVGSTAVLGVLGSLVFIYCTVLMIVGGYLVVETTYAYGHLSVWQGFVLVVIPLGTFVFWNVTGLEELSTAVSGGLYVAGALAAVGGVGFTLGRYDTFESTPAVGTIGERVIARETDDLVFVVDDRERITTINETAVETLGVERSDALGIPVGDVLGHDLDQVRPLETLTLETAGGTRRYDPEVSAVTDQHDTELGFILSLRDVTERELREQRLAVLNRVLRHNLRNKIEVVRSHAEVLRDRNGDGHAETILSTADEIAGLGYSARTIDQFVSASAGPTRVDLANVVRETVDRMEASGVSVSVTTPEAAAVEVNRAAINAALEEAIDNAITYADAKVEIGIETDPDGYEVQIVDDGPGIPAGELESLAAGTETALQHGSGLGLWQLKWAVQTIGGELSFDTTDGTAVTIVVPGTPVEEVAVTDGRTVESWHPEGDGTESRPPGDGADEDGRPADGEVSSDAT
jgi:PAS domain S-box-containing protein